MTTTFDRLRELFDRVSEMPSEEREAEIARATAGAPELAKEVRALLEQAERSDSPLDNAALRLREENEPPLPQIPGFRLDRRIGRGGSATVYLADQEHADFTREVALKLVDRVFDATSLWRVREEQRILARLEHPGIARLYDTGVTPAGQPYLAMEHVEGQSILDHCHSRDLPVRARLELFLAVLDAVAYAHDQGIIHRDLKPANILVTSRGEAKLLDFGIARLSDPADDDETRTLQRALTPAYASPEQVRGDRTTKASDIYSLGVVLYELLAGDVPYRFDEKRFGSLQEAIREQDPDPPSIAYARSAATTASTSAKDRLEFTRWRRALRGDLDAVVLKALRKEPEARYATAAAMADDVRRVLAGEPVAARRGDRVYRVGKWFRRHRVAVALLFVLIAAGAMQQLWSRRAVPAGPDSEFSVYDEAAGLDAETRRLLRGGGAQLARFDAARSRDTFRRAVVVARGHSPGEALAWDGVSRAEKALGEVGLSASAARNAGRLIAGHAGDLPRDEAERLRARALAADFHWSAAVPALDSLFGRQPGRVDIGLDLVAAHAAAGRSDAAGNVLGRLRQLSTPGSGSDPRIDLQEAEVAQQLSEYQRAAAAAARARDRARQLGATVLGLRAERLHGEALGRLDRRQEARRELESVVKRNIEAGLARETAAAQLALGYTMARSGGNDDARRMLETAFAGLTAAGDQRGQIVARLQLALQTAKGGRVAEALRSADVALADARRIGDRWSEGYVLSQRMVLLSWADDDNAVEATIAPTLAALRESGNRQTLLATLGNVSIFAIEHLQLDQAEAYIVEAEGLSRRIGTQVSSGLVDRAHGSLEQTRGDLDLAREHYVTAIDKARRAGVTLSIGYYLTDLAWLELDADRPDAATARANEAIAALNAAGDARLASATEAVLAWADARRGNHEAAHQRLARLRKTAAEDDSDSTEFNLLVAEARIAEAEGDWRKAAALRRRSIRMASEWKARGLVFAQQAGLARALHGAGDRAGLEKLVAEILPEVDRLGLRGTARDLRALLADGSRETTGGPPAGR